MRRAPPRCRAGACEGGRGCGGLMDQSGRTGLGTVLGLAILVLLVAAGYQLWTARGGSKPPVTARTSPGSPVSSAPVQPSGSSPTQSAPPVAPSGGQVRVAEPMELPASPHESLLAPIQKLIVQGSEAEAEADRKSTRLNSSHEW